MIANSVLRLFLILTIIIILAGIALIITGQFDEGYVFTGENPGFRAQQENLISHVYQSNTGTQASSDHSPAQHLQKAAVVIAAEKPPSTEMQSVAKPADKTVQSPPAAARPIKPQQPAKPLNQGVFAANPWEPYAEQGFDYQAQLLRNNPWSPHYKPGH